MKPATLPISCPPRVLRREQAAEYVGMSVTKFEQLVQDSRMPRPIRIDGCVRWDREKLDAAVSALSDEDASNPWDEVLA